MGGNFNHEEPSIFIQYIDVNNLYGWAMSKKLPTRGFKWDDVEPDDIERLTKLKNKGYLLEVDVKYPRVT